MGKNNIFKNALILFAITLISGALLGLVYELTKDAIAEQGMLRQYAALDSITPEVDTYNPLDVINDGDTAIEIREVLEIIKDNAVIGYNFILDNNRGYYGRITIAVGISSEGTINGIEIISHTETAGLGSRITEAGFKNQFKDEVAEPFKLGSSGTSGDNTIDSISSATVSSEAVVNGVNKAVNYYNEHLGGAQ
ncbi:electron transport complex protein RnfG [Natranaerovirga pectinivora]|uniref:Ion-translocating oxidoreductase complex subunit G n=1 Tax=Natranaerovirga pectinivora TaxID=682400 RepID=A0A4R3MQY2_9FIRM|nr:RnfABCDGE type electron transport complex subunit G [Natranaerovirga pectinivora]TCT14978.1 electron transport complex protein RnfG [Natranaerovirga pectinivora]